MDRIGSWTSTGTKPIILGESKTPALAYLVGTLGLVVTCFTTTQACAASHLLTAALGAPVAHLPFIGELFAPWAFGAWIWAAADVFSQISIVAQKTNAAHASSIGATQAYLYGPVCYTFLGGLVATVLSSLAVTVVSDARSKDVVTTITDTAHFWSVDEIRAKKNFLTADCGPIFGDIVTVPEKRFGPFVTRSEVREHLRWDGETGANIVGVQGSGKSAELKTNLLIPLAHPEAHKWTDAERRAHPFGYEPNIVALDTKGDLRRSTSGFQQHELGKNVFIFSPFSTDPGKVKIDTLHLIRLGTIHEFDDCRKAGIHIVDEGQGLKNHWDKTALDFCAALIATCGYEALSHQQPWRLSHPGLIDLVTRFTKPEQLIAHMMVYEHDPHGVFGWRDDDGGLTKQNPWIVKATNAMAAKESEEASGVYSTLLSYIGQFLSAVIRLHIVDSTFDMHAAANDPEKASVFYIDMPSTDLEQIRSYVRIMFRSFFSQLMNGTITIAGRELPSNLRATCLFMDEIKTLNKLEPLAESSGNMRGHKVQVYAIWQERGQIEECYGKNQGLTGNLGLQKYYQMQVGDDAAWLAKKCGQTTKTFKHRNASGHRFQPGPMGHLAENVQTVTVDNLTEYEARNIPIDEAIVFARGAQMRVKQVRYYENAELLRRSQLPAVEVSDVIVHRPFFARNLEDNIGPARYATLTSPAPDRWAEKREAASVDATGFRLALWEIKNKKTQATRYFVCIFLPDAEQPVLHESYDTAAERKKAIDLCMKTHSVDPENAAEQDSSEVQVPHTEGQSAVAVFALASGTHRDE